MRSPTSLADADGACGAKSATLGRLARAGFTVPDGFVIHDAAACAAYDELARLGKDRFAVRSSALVEDSRDASFAGQFLTLLDVPAERVAEAVLLVAASGQDAAGYATATFSVATKASMAAVHVPVLVQRMLRPVAAGVAFTRHPVTGRHAIVIEAVRGLGEALVSGAASPQRWEFTGGSAPNISGTQEVLALAQAEEIRDLARHTEDLLGGGQDMEWAIDADGVAWVLQSRPITTSPPDDTGATSHLSGTTTATAAAAPAAAVVAATAAPAVSQSARHLASGTAAGLGIATGRVRVLKGLDDFGRFAAGEVLVCRATSPAWTPILLRAAAVVTQVGGMLAHAAIVAREMGIPAITDVAEALDLPDGARVTVDGTRGIITLTEEL